MPAGESSRAPLFRSAPPPPLLPLQACAGQIKLSSIRRRVEPIKQHRGIIKLTVRSQPLPPPATGTPSLPLSPLLLAHFGSSGRVPWPASTPSPPPPPVPPYYDSVTHPPARLGSVPPPITHARQHRVSGVASPVSCPRPRASSRAVRVRRNPCPSLSESFWPFVLIPRNKPPPLPPRSRRAAPSARSTSGSCVESWADTAAGNRPSPAAPRSPVPHHLLPTCPPLPRPHVVRIQLLPSPYPVT